MKQSCLFTRRVCPSPGKKSPCSTNFYKRDFTENEFRGNFPGPWVFIPSNQTDPLLSARDVVAVLTRVWESHTKKKRLLIKRYNRIRINVVSWTNHIFFTRRVCPSPGENPLWYLCSVHVFVQGTLPRNSTLDGAITTWGGVPREIPHGHGYF